MFPMRTSASRANSDSGANVAEKNFGLSAQDFDKMVTLLRSGDERLFEQIYFAQFSFCQRKLMSFDGLSEQEAYDATMDALIHFRDLLLQGKVGYGNLRYLFVRIARQLFSRKRGKLTVVRGITPEELNLADQQDFVYEEDSFSELNRAFKQLGMDCRRLLHEFYFNRRSLQELAEEEDKPSATIRKQKSRCVQRLRKLCIPR
jgi:RNA polymerase sigma factor (sigma-70 family)